MHNSGALALAQLNGMQPLLMSLATPVFSETKCLPGERSVENNRECLSEIIEASYFYLNVQIENDEYFLNKFTKEFLFMCVFVSVPCLFQ